MNTPLNAVPESSIDTIEASEIAPAAVAATRPLYWSIRRELWENSSIYLAPLIVAVFYLLGLLISVIRIPKTLAALADPVNQRAMIQTPYHVAAFVLLLTAFFTGAFYCLDALYGERRDRSVLFWKSLPVSDLTTVLAKACIPLAILPLITFVVILATQIVIFLLSTGFALGNGLSAAALWAQLPLWKMWISLLCAIVTSALWYLPPLSCWRWRGFTRRWSRRKACCISGSVNWTEIPCCAATFVTIRFHSTLPSHAMRDPYFWTAISNPKRTAALSWLRTVTMRPRSMTETCPLST